MLLLFPFIHRSLVDDVDRHLISRPSVNLSLFLELAAGVLLGRSWEILLTSTNSVSKNLGMLMTTAKTSVGTVSFNTLLEMV